MDRRNLLLSMFDSSGFGLEVGPSYSPLVPKKLGYNVETVDYADAAQLREKYRTDSSVDINNIEDVDYVSDGGSLVTLIGEAGRYDYIVASHVIEHVTDVVRFLSDCEQLLKPSGVLVLAVPDKRFCFDALRPVSTVGSAIQTYLDAPSRHSPGMVFDHCSLVSKKDGDIVWLEPSLDGVELISTIADAKAALDQARNQAEYIDIHRWQFTPNYFRYFIRVLEESGFIGLRETEFYKNKADGLSLHEFYISLSRAGAGPGMPVIDLLKLAHAELREIKVSIRGGADAHAGAEYDARDPFTALAGARDELRSARAELDAMRQSTSWRLTAPIRSVKRLLSRR